MPTEGCLSQFQSYLARYISYQTKIVVKISFSYIRFPMSCGQQSRSQRHLLLHREQDGVIYKAAVT